MASALAALGLTVKQSNENTIVASNWQTTVTWTKGSGTVVRSTDRTFAERLPTAYGTAALKTAAKKYGWDWKQSSTKENVYTVMKR
jgi:hypothetical protein